MKLKIPKLKVAGSHIKVREVPSETSKKIRGVLMSVPDGFVYDLSNIDGQIAEQRQKIKAAQERDRFLAGLEEECQRITGLKTWQKLSGETSVIPLDSCRLLFLTGRNTVFTTY